MSFICHKIPRRVTVSDNICRNVFVWFQQKFLIFIEFLCDFYQKFLWFYIEISVILQKNKKFCDLFIEISLIFFTEIFMIFRDFCDFYKSFCDLIFKELCNYYRNICEFLREISEIFTDVSLIS